MERLSKLPLHSEHIHDSITHTDRQPDSQTDRESACVVPTVKHGEGGEMGSGGFAGDSVGDLFRIQGTLNQHGYHSMLQ